MKERPILFSAPMVRAILAGTKTQTRRVVKPQPWASCAIEGGMPGEPPFVYSALFGDGPGHEVGEKRTPCRCPYGQPGDRLWVREAWMDLWGTGVEHRDRDGNLQRFAYRADTPPGSYGDEARKDYGLKWRPSIHMPRAASRITLEVTGVRVERLQDISEADAIAEGIERGAVDGRWKLYGRDTDGDMDRSPRVAYRSLWESINGPGTWVANPWVWVGKFSRVEARNAA